MTAVSYVTTVERIVKPRLHDTIGCQTGCTTRFENRLNEQWLFVQHGCQTGCQADCTAGLTTVWRDNRFHNRLYRVNGVLNNHLRLIVLLVIVDDTATDTAATHIRGGEVPTLHVCRQTDLVTMTTMMMMKLLLIIIIIIRFVKRQNVKRLPWR